MTGDFASTVGPMCPYCGHTDEPDGPSYYSDFLKQLECSECEKVYRVEVYRETTWTTGPIA